MRETLRSVKDSRKFDWIMLIVVALLMVIGIALVYSATADEAVDWTQALWFRQILHFVAGWIIVGVVLFTKPMFWYRIAYPMYAVSLVGLVLVLFAGGVESHGAGRWIGVGSVRIQPSEFAKIGYLLMIARYFSSAKVNLQNPSSFVLPGFLFLVPFLLVLKQPDLSTALVFVSITLMLFYWSGLRLSDVFLLISPGLSVVATMSQSVWATLMAALGFVLWRRRLPLWLAALILVLNIAGGFASYKVWNSLEDHQRGRILTFLNPGRDPRGAGYQVIQSKVAIGSGGLIGKGYGSGSQTNLSFLPEEHTDFIFSVLGEQFGFVGGLVVLFLFLTLLGRAFSITQLHEERFAVLVTVGAATILAFHMFVNVGMTLGMMPVTGLPLPFLSYGGSFVITCMVLVGLMLLMRLKGDEL